jgi:16S rRNA (cytosine967-C5)-methyltransferase
LLLHGGGALPPGARVLDACAAPGGKTAHLLELADLDLLALDSDPARLARVQQTLDRLRLKAALVAADARETARWWDGRPFDAILLDAPCSGLGTLARNPDLRWRSRPGDPERQAQRQRRLLEALAPLVRPGGQLVYAVCSLEPEENEGVVEPFLAARADFAKAPLPGWAAPFADGPYLRTRPESHGGDGFFAASLRRQL